MSVQNSLPISLWLFVLLFTLQTYSSDQMALKIPASDPRNIVIIGIFYRLQVIYSKNHLVDDYK